MSMVVDLPAPFGPSSATVSPGAIVMSTPRTACTGPFGDLKVFVSPESTMPLSAAVRDVARLVEVSRHDRELCRMRLTRQWSAPVIGG